MGNSALQRSAIVAIDGLTVRYGPAIALSHLTVSFPPGATGLLGVNGAGKTTLIHAILGLVTPDGGRVRVFGKDAATEPLAVRARVGYAPERDAIIPETTAIESVTLCGRLGGLPADDALLRAHDVLTDVGLGESRYRPVEQFSAGMRQRLKLAQALVHDPDLLILDEPTNGLDPHGRGRMLELIATLAGRRGRHLILSSHILADVERVCGGFVLLHGGALVAAGRADDWRDPDECTFDVATNGDRDQMAAALREAQIPCATADGPMLAVRLPGGDARAVFRAAQALHVSVRRLRRRRPALDEIVERLLDGGVETLPASLQARPPAPTPEERVRDLIVRLDSLVEGQDAAARLVACGVAAVEPLRAFLLDTRPRATHQPRLWAVEALGGLGADDVLVAYLALPIRSDDAVVTFAERTVRSAAARLLARSSAAGAADVLIRAARDEHLPGALEALAVRDPERATPILIEALGDAFTQPAAHAALCRIGRAGRPALIDAALDASEGPHAHLARRRAALDVLSEIGMDATQWRRLEPILDEDDPALVCTASLLGADISPDPARIARRLLTMLPAMGWEWLGTVEDLVVGCVTRAGGPDGLFALPPASDRLDVVRAWRHMRERCMRSGPHGGAGEAT